MEGEITLLNVKPAVGFTLPSAGVTPAPSINREMARTPFRSQVLPCVIQSEAKNPGSFFASPSSWGEVGLLY